ncbi:6-hydroxymethylpterin diphosphokinase MptE-like protein, partial [Acidianus sp. RZ1]
MDYKSAVLLNSIIKEDYSYSLEEIKGKKVAIVGAGPSLQYLKDIDADLIIAADGASNYLKTIGIIPDIV